MAAGGRKATFKGTGPINREGACGFLLSAVDGQPDTFRMKIVDRSMRLLIHDIMAGGADAADPTTAVAIGAITIAKPGYTPF